MRRDNLDILEELPLIGMDDVLLIVGPPGAGKGTQTPMLEAFGFPVISTGALLRKEIASGSELGKLADSLLKEGQLFPDDLTLKMLAKNLPASRCVLDGYPRTKEQCKDLDQFLHLQGRKVCRVLYLHVPDEEVRARILKRMTCKVCSQPSPPDSSATFCARCKGELVRRVDDNEETIEKRLAVYHNLTAELLTYYNDRLIKFDGLKSPADVWEDIKQTLSQ